MATATFAFGAAIHTLRLIIGIEAIVAHVLTPRCRRRVRSLHRVHRGCRVAVLAQLLGWQGGPRWLRFAMFMLIVSVPLHLRTALTWSTAYLTAFPIWYSVVGIPMFLALVLMMSRLRFRDSAQNVDRGG